MQPYTPVNKQITKQNTGTLKKILVILFVFNTLTLCCQEENGPIDPDSHSTLPTFRSIEFSILLHQRTDFNSPLHTSGTYSFPAFAESGYRIETAGISREGQKSHRAGFMIGNLVFPLFGNSISVWKKKIFPNWEPFFSVLLNRNVLYSNRYLMNSRISNPLGLAVSFGAGIRLLLSHKVLFDLGLRDEFGVFSNREFHFRDRYRKTSGSLGLTLGLRYRI